jgi:hypothetical protein
MNLFDSVLLAIVDKLLIGVLILVFELAQRAAGAAEGADCTTERRGTHSWCRLRKALGFDRRFVASRLPGAFAR